MYIEKIIANQNGELWRSKRHEVEIGDKLHIDHPGKYDKDGNWWEVRLVMDDEITVLKSGRLRSSITEKL